MREKTVLREMLCLGRVMESCSVFQRAKGGGHFREAANFSELWHVSERSVQSILVRRGEFQ